MSVAAIKLIHTLIFLFLSGCILYILYCGIANRYSRKTAAAILLVVAEGVILILNDWQCPLTTWAARLGATQPDAASLFLPPWLAEHVFGICTPLFIGSSVLALFRWRRSRR